MLHLVLCVCVNQNIQSAAYLFGLSVFVPGHKCDAALRLHAFIWKMGQSPRESPSLSISLTLCHFSHIFSCLFLFSHLHPSFSIFLQPLILFSHLSILSSLTSCSICPLLCESVTLTHTRLFICTHSFNTDTHTHLFARSIFISLSHTLLPYSGSFPLCSKSILLSYIIRSVLSISSTLLERFRFIDKGSLPCSSVSHPHTHKQVGFQSSVNAPIASRPSPSGDSMCCFQDNKENFW